MLMRIKKINVKHSTRKIRVYNYCKIEIRIMIVFSIRDLNLGQNPY